MTPGTGALSKILHIARLPITATIGNTINPIPDFRNEENSSLLVVTQIETLICIAIFAPPFCVHFIPTAE